MSWFASGLLVVVRAGMSGAVFVAHLTGTRMNYVLGTRTDATRSHVSARPTLDTPLLHCSAPERV
jgi:hypothetical protein